VSPPLRTSDRLRRGAAVAIIAIVSVLLVIGVTLLPLLTPVYTRTVAGLFNPQERADLSRERSLEMAEEVRRFVTDPDSETLPSVVDDREGFDASSVAHLADVRDVMISARVATGVAAGVLAIAIMLLLARKEWRVLGAGLRGGGYMIIGAVLLLGVAGIVDFDGLFAGFHGIFFESGTWTFPSGSLLIQLFPEQFWAVSAALWAALIAVGAGSLWWLGGYALAHEGPHEGTRA